MAAQLKPNPPASAPTPGPWCVQWRGTCRDRFYICEQGGAQIATLYTSDKGVDENAANGRLLAAAPAMLAALEYSLDYLSEFEGDVGHLPKPLDDLDAELRAAIDKAKG